ncbi:precorrin-2 dehydrogenase/sirohydrochlorin ferrochelatase family protein, partial [Teichococcus cervicalis]
MRHLPIHLDLRGRTALLLGGGAALATRASLLEQAGAVLRHVEALAPDSLDGVALACAGEAPEAALQALAATCRARGLPLQVLGRPELSDHYLPAIIDRDPVTLSIGTGGAAPVLARLLRQRVEAALAPGLGAM